MQNFQNLSQTEDAFRNGYWGYSLLDSFIPGYSIVSGILANYLGVDVSSLVPWLGLLFAMSKMSDYFFYHFQYQFLKWFTCSIVLNSDLDMYFSISRFLADKKGVGKSTSSLNPADPAL